jgi:hypothetical protein
MDSDGIAVGERWNLCSDFESKWSASKFDDSLAFLAIQPSPGIEGLFRERIPQ